MKTYFKDKHSNKYVTSESMKINALATLWLKLYVQKKSENPKLWFPQQP